ncbi:MAG: glutamine-hydrolyzing carbamoyl-phosphate synthase small subunit [Thermoanaerobaculia bacterium]
MKPSSSDAILILEDGSVFEARAVSEGTRFGEVVFNTAMTGYQEILTDPSYRGQIVVMTLPHIGNYGVAQSVAESDRPWVEGFVARRFTDKASSHASEEELVTYLKRHRIPALDRLDTRAVVRRIRRHGALRGVVTTERSDVARLIEEVCEFPSMAGKALVHEVTCAEPYRIEPSEGIEPNSHLAVMDFGVKANILRSLADRGASLTVFPAATTADEVIGAGVDGVVLSNGPGDPEPLVEVVAEIRRLIDHRVPLFGICLGHQLLGLAMGGKTYKLKFGHHGANQSVKDHDTGRVLITSQNHGFAVDPDSLPPNCRVNQTNLNDGTIEAFVVEDRPVLSTQYHPEAAPGPHDASDLFDRFLAGVAGESGRASARTSAGSP